MAHKPHVALCHLLCGSLGSCKGFPVVFLSDFFNHVSYSEKYQIGHAQFTISTVDCRKPQFGGIDLERGGETSDLQQSRVICPQTSSYSISATSNKPLLHVSDHLLCHSHSLESSPVSYLQFPTTFCKITFIEYCVWPFVGT